MQHNSAAMNNTGKRSTFRLQALLLTLVLGATALLCNPAVGQTLGTVWVRDYENIAPNGSASSLTPQPLYYAATGQSRYLLCGTTSSREGFIAMLDEAGNVLRQWNIPIPSYYNKYPKQNASERGGYELGFYSSYSSWYGISNPDDILQSIISSAVMKPDGSILAFGYVRRHNAGSWSIGEQDYSPGSHAICRMKMGVWKICISPEGEIIENERARGAEAYKMLIYNDKILLPGLDHHTSNTGDGNGVGMLHEYDLDGNFLYERVPADKDVNAVTGVRKMPNGDIFLDGWQSDACVVEPSISSGTPGSYPSKLSFGASIVNPTATNVPLSGTGTVDEGFFVNPQFSLASNSRTGATFAKVMPNGSGGATVAYRVINNPSSRAKVYYNPLVLDPVNRKYVGTVEIGGKYMMYILTDELTSASIDESAEYPKNTTLQDVSLTDGFFAMANNLSGSKRVITLAKLSSCANFTLNVGETGQYVITGQTLAGRTITHAGNQPSGTVTYSWTLKDVTAGGKAIAELATGKSGTTNVLPSQVFTLLPGKLKGEAEYVITAVDSYLNNGVPQSCTQTYSIRIEVFTPPSASSLFSDDVWFFGSNLNSSNDNERTSRGIVFRKDENGKPKAYDYSRVSMVNSYENSLSVSTPACDGSYIFYVQHNKVFNSNHVQMAGVTFEGDNSNSDGLAACYIGNNRYMLFAVDKAEVKGKLHYRYINMSTPDGLGEVLPGGTIDNTTIVNEAIELIPRAGTYDQYWLIYHAAKNDNGTAIDRLRVVAIDGSQANPIGNIVCDVAAPVNTKPTIDNTYYGMRSNTTFDKIAISVRNSGHVAIYNFNPASGQLSPHVTINERPYVYGTAFSPSGEYIYAVPYNTSSGYNMVKQYKVSTGEYVDEAPYGPSGVQSGGGMKLGPDGRIYILREHTKYMGIINNPDMKLSDGGGIDLQGLELNSWGGGLEPSVGLTPPWVTPPSSNHAPTAVPDAVTSFARQAVTISPLANDTDSDALQDLYLVNAELINVIADGSKGSVSFNANNKTVTFTPNPSYSFTDGEEIHIRYQIRDNGLPVAMCDDNGLIVVTLRYGKLNLTLTPGTEVNEGSTFKAKVCLPEGMLAPTGGIPFTLAILGTGASASDISGTLTGTIAANTQCTELTFTATTDNLLEGNEVLELKPSTTAANFVEAESKSVTIKDMTPGEIIAELVNPLNKEAAEPNGVNTFVIRFATAGVTCARSLEVSFTLTGTAVNGTDYSKINDLKVTIPPNTHSVTVPITVTNNYVVQGNRDVTITLTGVN